MRFGSISKIKITNQTKPINFKKKTYSNKSKKKSIEFDF